MKNKDSKKERFFMAVFIVSYTGLFLSIFFWEMAGVSFICSRSDSLSFRLALVILTILYCVLYFMRISVVTPMDGFIICGSLAAGISSFFMGGGTGAWLLDQKFLIDLGICTVSLIIMLTSVFFHSAGEFREMINKIDEDEEKKEEHSDDQNRPE